MSKMKMFEEQNECAYGSGDYTENQIQEYLQLEDTQQTWDFLLDGSLNFDHYVTWWELWPWPRGPGSSKWLSCVKTCFGEKHRFYEFAKKLYKEARVK